MVTYWNLGALIGVIFLAEELVGVDGALQKKNRYIYKGERDKGYAYWTFRFFGDTWETVAEILTFFDLYYCEKHN